MSKLADVESRSWAWLFEHAWRPNPETKQRLRLNVPDTVLFSEAEPTLWLFTTKEGELKRKIAGLEAAIAEMKEGIATLKDDIKALSDGIVALDKSRKRADARDRGEFKFRSTYNASMTYIDVYVLFVFVQ